MATSQPPLEALPAWALLNDVELNNAKLDNIEGKGFGLLLSDDQTSNAEITQQRPLLTVSRDLILSAEAVEGYAKVDQNFRQLWESAGRKSTRHDIRLCLFVHIVSLEKNLSGFKKPTSTPWTEYIKFLPKDIPLPTLWSATERELLNGTSLEIALPTKLSSLAAEFDKLHEATSNLPYWNDILWEKETAKLEHWILADAWFRSRSLELPQLGDSMVPVLDMANHSHEPNAFYEEDGSGGVTLLLRPHCGGSSGQEINISYGDNKAAAEMLFSYGFIIHNSSSSYEMTLPVPSIPGDPLGDAKRHYYGGPPVVIFSRSDGSVTWESPWLHLVCLNEEDGLAFRIMQDAEGGREMKVFWQDEDVTERAQELESLTAKHEQSAVFRLRAVVILQQIAVEQLQTAQAPLGPSGNDVQPREDCVRSAIALKEIEMSILEDAIKALGEEQTTLLADKHVAAYLGLAEDTPIEQASTSATNEEIDFS